MKKSLVIITCVWLLLIVGCTSPAATSIPQAEPSPTEPPKLDLHDVLYVPEGDSRQGLDVYLPADGEGPFPTILAFHGGGFRARSKSLYAPVASHFTDQGYALVASNYRYALSSTPYPAQVEDAFCALGWIFTNAADYGFDTDHVFVIGDSAGGYLASMVGTVQTPDLYRGNCPHVVPEVNPVRGAIVLYGFYDLTSVEGHRPSDVEGGLKALMGATHSEVPPEQLIEMSPMSWVDGSEPPFLILHGTLDRTIASWLSENFAAWLEKEGVEARLVLLEDQHGFILQSVSSPTMTKALEAIDSFLRELSES